VPTSLPSISTFTDAAVVSPFDPKQSPSKAAAYWLRRDIVRGVFMPAERLKVEHLVKFYGVGHSPIREAIILLSSSGLVVHEHQKGYRVAPVSLEDYDDVVNVYQHLYMLAVDMALDREDSTWEERMVVQLHRSAKVQQVMPDGEPEAREKWQRAYGELHAQILSGCNSPLMLQLISDIGAKLERYVGLFADFENVRERQHHTEHREIVDALLTRDRAKAHDLIQRYFAAGQPFRASVIEVLKRNRITGSRRGRKPQAALQPA
jgi:GntR family carbon starvation induced transcriptional regulator